MLVIVCDDQAVYREQFMVLKNNYLEKYPEKEITVRQYSSGEELLKKIQEGCTCDGYFLDIQLPGVTDGYRLALEIRKKDPAVPVVFFSNYDDYLREGYAVGIYRYLKKPLTEEELFPCFDYCLKTMDLSGRVISFRYRDRDNEIVSMSVPLIKVSRIHYDSHYITVYLEGIEYRYYVRESFKTVLEKDLNGSFIQCNQSDAVNPEYVQSYSHREVFLENGTTVPLTKGYMKEAEIRFITYFAGI